MAFDKSRDTFAWWALVHAVTFAGANANKVMHEGFDPHIVYHDADGVEQRLPLEPVLDAMAEDWKRQVNKAARAQLDALKHDIDDALYDAFTTLGFTLEARQEKADA